MKVKLAVDYTVCIDGIHPSSFRAGEEAEFPERIASVLIGDGRATPAQETSMEQKPIENKMEPTVLENKRKKKKELDAPPTNKMIHRAPFKKRR